MSELNDMQTDDIKKATVLCPIQQFSNEGKIDTTDTIVREAPLTILLNNREIVTLLCSPVDLDSLAVGFLVSEGLLKGKDEIKETLVDARTGIVRVNTYVENEHADEILFKRLVTSGCGRGASFYQAGDAMAQAKVEFKTTISAPDVFALMKEFQHRSQLFKATGGVHSAALCAGNNFLCFKEDIGRHNAIDKIFGDCLLHDIPTEGRLVLTSGRISSEVITKVARRNIPILISKSAPMNLGVEYADRMGVTLIGFVRGQRMNVYANGWRVVSSKN